MSLTDIQFQVDDWTSQFTPQYWPPLEMLARLSEETGELAREINHMYGTKKKKPTEDTKNLKEELVDVIFTIVCIANSHNINLQDEWNKSMKEKMNKRDINRFERKD